MQKLDGNFLASPVTSQKPVVNNLDNHMVVSVNGGYCRYPNSWMVYNGKSYEKTDDLGVALF